LFYHQLFPFQPPGTEITNVHTCPTVPAPIKIRPLDEISLIADLIFIDEVPAAVVAAEADAIHTGSGLIVAERPGDQMFFLRLLEDRAHIGR
jgi:hypothetical protein